MQVKMRRQGCNDIYVEKPKYYEKNLNQCYLFHHKSHTDWDGIEP